MTTTATMLHPESEMRLLSLTVRDSPSQTRDVLLSMADEDDAQDAPWLALQDYSAVSATGPADGVTSTRRRPRSSTACSRAAPR